MVIELKKLIRICFSKMTKTELRALARKAKIILSRAKNRKPQLVDHLTNVFNEKPALLDKFKIKVYKHSVIKQLLVSTKSGPDGFVSVTDNSFFCLEDLFSLKGSDFQRGTSKNWLRKPKAKTFIDAISVDTNIGIGDLIVQKEAGRTYVHRLVALEAARDKSPSLAVSFQRVVEDYFSKKSAAKPSVGLTVAKVESHPHYKKLLAENEKLKELAGTVTNESLHRFGMEKSANYSVYSPDSDRYKMGKCINIDETLAAYRRLDASIQVVAIVYHENTASDRDCFERIMGRRFVEYNIGGEQYGLGLTHGEIISIWKQIISGAGFSVTWESQSEIDKYNGK